MPEESGEEDEVEEVEGETKSAKVRYWLTNDLAALLLVGVLCLLMLLAAADVYQPPGEVILTFVGAASAAVVWLFGKGAAKEIFGSGE